MSDLLSKISFKPFKIVSGSDNEVVDPSVEQPDFLLIEIDNKDANGDSVGEIDQTTAEQFANFVKYRGNVRLSEKGNHWLVYRTQQVYTASDL